jgi:hypothetical protein
MIHVVLNVVKYSETVDLFFETTLFIFKKENYIPNIILCKFRLQSE